MFHTRYQAITELMRRKAAGLSLDEADEEFLAQLDAPVKQENESEKEEQDDQSNF